MDPKNNPPPFDVANLIAAAIAATQIMQQQAASLEKVLRLLLDMQHTQDNQRKDH